MLRLAGPIVLSELGWMSMGLVDTMMVGRVSPEAMGAVSIGGMLFYTIAITGLGLLLGLDTLVSQAFGAGDIADCHRSLLSGIYMSVLLSPVLMGIVWLSIPFLRAFGINPAVLRDTMPYIDAIVWSTLPLLLFFALRRYLQGMNLVKPVMLALVTANFVNLAGNWVLVYGNFGAPAMGAAGSGWATCVSRIYMTAALLAYVIRHDRQYRGGLMKTSWLPDAARIGLLFRLGMPAGLQLFFEISVFAAVTALIGRLDAASLGGHQIALNLASLAYMVPLGIGSAAAVRVGQALGRGEPKAAARSGWIALLLGAGFMSLAAFTFLIAPRLIARVFATDPAVIKMGAALLMVAAVFELFDGIQTVVTGALRGAGDTRTPMICHLVCYWLLGLPLGYFLAFRLGWGAVGLWAGLCAALIVIGVILLIAWYRKARTWTESPSRGGRT
ncbi:MAG: MATE family efflux transporter [Acidobacteriota bacterium]|nr:MATE family efflux transporter [Acidobacteriota bacterium]